MTNRDLVIDYLRSIAPRSATNADIGSGTRISPHQQVFQITQSLVKSGEIVRRMIGREWHFTVPSLVKQECALQSIPSHPGREDGGTAQAKLTPLAFEELARVAMSRHFNAPLRPGQVSGVPKRFDFVSDDFRIVGDAKYYTLVRGTDTPPAKFSVIAEHVWLLEKTRAVMRFLVFGNDRQVPEAWLAKYGGLATSCDFYFLSADGQVQRLPK